MAEQKFRLPGSSYEELQKIIVGYSHIKGKASNADVSKRAGLHPTIVSRNGGFLIECEIVEPGQKKEIAPKGMRLAQAIEHKLSDEIQKAWIDIFEAVPFFDTVLSAVRIRGGMDQSTLKSHIAYTAGQKKNQWVMTGTQTVIDILGASGCLIEHDGLLTVANEISFAPDSATTTTATLTEPKITPADARKASPVTIQIQIQVKPDDLKDLGEKLRKVLDDLSRDADPEQD